MLAEQNMKLKAYTWLDQFLEERNYGKAGNLSKWPSAHILSLSSFSLCISAVTV